MWTIAECAVQGKSHIKDNIPCQDKTFSVSVSKSFQVVSLADGAGSACLSHIGAKIITEHVCNHLISNFDSYYNNDDGIEVKKHLIASIKCRLQDEANKNNCSIKDLASTLLCVAKKNNKFILLHLGDGVIGYLKDDVLKIASVPQNDEFVNETTFTTSQNAINKFFITKGNLDNIDSFILMSDGPEVAFYNKRSRILSKSIRKLVILSKLFNKNDFETLLSLTIKNTIQNYTRDDCSMVFFTRAEYVQSFSQLSYKDKCYILNISLFSPKRINRRFFSILEHLSNSDHSAKELSHLVHLKEKYLSRYLIKLTNNKFITKYENKYKLAIIF